MTGKDVDRICRELQRIADTLEKFLPEPEMEPPPPRLELCSHPMDLRTDFGMTDGMPDWECGLCRYRSHRTP